MRRRGCHVVAGLVSFLFCLQYHVQIQPLDRADEKIAHLAHELMIHARLCALCQSGRTNLQYGLPLEAVEVTEASAVVWEEESEALFDTRP